MSVFSTMEESIKLVFDYIPVMPYAILASSLSVRTLGELHGAVGQKKEWSEIRSKDFLLDMDKDLDSTFTYAKKKVNVQHNEKHGFGHSVCFQKDEVHPTYSACMIDVQDIKQVERVLWWLQRMQPGSLQLQNVEELSAEELRQVLDLLFTDTPVLPECVPLYSNLLEFHIQTDAFVQYACTNILEALGKCTSLKKIDVSKCKSLDRLDGLEKFTQLEELDVSFTPLCDLTWLRNCKGMSRLHTLKLCSCERLITTIGIEALSHLKHVHLTASSVASLAGLEHCTSLRVVHLSDCKNLKDITAVKSLSRLEALDISFTNVNDLSALNEVKGLAELDIGSTPMQDISPLKNCRALKGLYIMWSPGVDSIEALKGMGNLERLYLTSTSVNDVAPLADCKRLQVLCLSGCCNVKSVAPLASMTALKKLSLTGTAVVNLEPLVNLIQTGTLNVTL